MIKLNHAARIKRLLKKDPVCLSRADKDSKHRGGFTRERRMLAKARSLEELSQVDKLVIDDEEEVNFPCVEAKKALVASIGDAKVSGHYHAKDGPKAKIDADLKARLKAVTVVPRVIGKVRGKRIDLPLEQVIKLRFTNKLSCAQIGAFFNVDGKTISKKLARYMAHLPDVPTLNRLDSVRGDIIKGTLFNQITALNDPRKIEKASLNNVAYSAGQLHNMLRLEEGKSTANIFSAEYFAFIKERGQLTDESSPTIQKEDVVDATCND